ncbi:MAG: cytochrome P450 [Dehalococcoidia bacterium]|nr:cytochrome P450 [Dehalococcoidia bacterium]MCB9483401.1 cytochrome P450 [Dehalococcoidia bacterium]MCB9491595.1 cytochrome P450 [Dehalococcoidia bacterium]
MVAEKATHDINLHNVNLFLHDEFHEAFRVLRREAPVHWNPGSARANGFWSMTKYEDILTISRHPEIFISSRGIAGSGEREQDPEAAAAEAARPRGEGTSSIITMDPPRHVKMRRLVNKGFTPRAVNSMEPKIRQMTREILDEVGDRKSGDFVLEVSSRLPLAVICGLMGLPRESWDLMFELTNAALGAGDPEYQQAQTGESGHTNIAKETARRGNMRMAQYFRDVMDDRRANPQDDLISLLLEAEVDGDKLTEGEILAFCNLLVVAGNETTRNAISGGMVVLDRNPEERAKLQSDIPKYIDGAVEEMLRWTSPLHHMTREATEDFEIRGQHISPGEKVIMWYPSANRDEDVFEDPYKFDIERTPNDHLAFGIGEHFCLGAGFARKEVKVMFEELFDRYPNIKVTGEPDRLRSSFINGVKHLEVDYK